MIGHIKGLHQQQADLAAFGGYAFRETGLFRIFEMAARTCAGSLGARHCAIGRYRCVENDLLVEAGFGWRPGIIGTAVSPADERSPQGRACVTREPVVVRGSQEMHAYDAPGFYREYGIVSTVGVPIVSGAGPPFGVLEVESTAERSYDEHDINFLTGFANVLAEAVAAHGRNRVLRATVAEMATIAAEKERLQAERDVLAMELRHRVRNNLQLINVMVTTVLRQPSDVARSRGLERMIGQIMSLAEVYEHMLGAGIDGQVDFGSYAVVLCANLHAQRPASEHAIILDCHAEAVRVSLATATALGLVLTDLISNSYEHACSSHRGRIDLRIRGGDMAGQGVITIADHDVGYLAATETNHQGEWLVRRLMQQVRGTLDTGPGTGNVWTLRFPTIDADRIAIATA
ncbi:MAG TPA: GAF domain-containing protein [Rhodopila sp.]